VIKNPHPPFRIATIAVFAAIILPTLFQDGMFMDGLLYACVGKNLSQGMGSWWHPHFSDTFKSDYHEQPPMLFWLQSIFFRVLGTGYWVERFYSLLAALANAFLISRLWKKLFPKTNEQRNFSWLPVLFWISMPVIYFTFINNLEEGTMSIFALSSVYCIISALNDSKNKYLLLILGGLFIFCSGMTKGIQGTFPVATVFFYWLASGKISIREMLRYSAVVIAVPVVIFALLLTNQTVYESFRSYYYTRIYFTFHNEDTHTTGNHFSLLFRLLGELSPSCVLVGIIYILSRLLDCRWKFSREVKRDVIFLLLTGLSASLPLMVTLEQRSFYLATSLPYFGLCLAMLAMPGITGLFSKISVKSVGMKVLLYAGVLVIVSSLAFSFILHDKPKREAGALADCKIIASETGNGVVLGTTQELFRRWSLQGYFMRYYNICLEDGTGENRKYLLLAKEQPFAEHEKYLKVDLPLTEFELLKLRSSSPELKLNGF
jgi:4-amino-4-deoxy-L-arabinose transferase-like glycosyltransferase